MGRIYGMTDGELFRRVIFPLTVQGVIAARLENYTDRARLALEASSPVTWCPSLASSRSTTPGMISLMRSRTDCAMVLPVTSNIVKKTAVATAVTIVAMSPIWFAYP